MARKTALGLGALLVIAAVVVALQPAAFVVERSVTIAAPAAAIYGHIASVRAMDEWSPWTKMDPRMQTVYDGPESGVGSRSSWDGPQMGKGRVTVTAVQPDREIEMRLELLAPMEGTNRVLFTLTPVDRATSVTWHMEGRNGFVGKAFSLFGDMDAMVGGPFEQGLASLKQRVEADAQQHALD